MPPDDNPLNAWSAPAAAPPSAPAAAANPLSDWTSPSPEDEEQGRRRRKVQQIASEEMNNYLALPTNNRGFTAPSSELRQRLAREVPDLHPDDIEAVGQQFDQAARQGERNKAFADVLGQEKQSRYLNPAGSSADRAMFEEGMRLMPLAGPIYETVQGMRAAGAQERLRQGTETEDDRRLIARQMIAQQDEAQQGAGMTVWRGASSIPSAVINLETAGGLAPRSLGIAGKIGAQGLSMAPQKFAQRIQPGVALDAQGNQVVGPEKNTLAEAGKAVGSGVLEAGVMHGVGQVGKVLRGTPTEAPPSLLERAGLYGLPEGLAQGRVNEAVQYGVGLSDSMGVLGDLGSGDPDRQKGALAQLAGETVGLAAAGGGERAFLASQARAALTRTNSLERQGLAPEAVRQQVQQDFQPLFDRLKAIQAEARAGAEDIGRQTKVGVQMGLLGDVATAGQGLRPQTGGEPEPAVAPQRAAPEPQAPPAAPPHPLVKAGVPAEPPLGSPVAPRSNGVAKQAKDAWQGRILRALTDEDVGTESEVLQHLKGQVKDKGGSMSPADLKAALASLDRMVQAGEIEKHTFGDDDEPIYVPHQEPDLEAEAGKADLYARTQALRDAAQKAFLESLNADRSAAERARGPGAEASVRRAIDQDVQKGGAPLQAEYPPEAVEGNGAAGNPPAAAGAEAAGRELTPPAVAPREWAPDPHLVRAEARHRLEGMQPEYERLRQLHLDIRKELAKEPGNPPFNTNLKSGPADYHNQVAWRKLEDQDANSIRGIDVIAERLSQQNREGQFYTNSGEADFGRDPIEARDRLFEFLTKPPPEPPSQEEMEARVRDQMIADRAARTEDEEGRADEPEGVGAGEVTEVEPGINFLKTPSNRSGPSPNKGQNNPAPAPPPTPQTAPPPSGWVGRLGRGLREFFNPASVSPASQATAGNLRQREAELTRSKEQAQDALYDAKAQLDRDVASEKDPQLYRQKFLAFTKPYEEGQAAPPGYQEFYDAIRKGKDEDTAELARRGLLKSFIDNHLGHLWKDPKNAAASPSELGQRVASRRSLSGAGGFKKQRQMPTWEDGFDAGLEPAFRNPIEAEWARRNEMRKAIAGHDFFEEEQANGRIKYLPLGTRAPEGWVQPNDKTFRVYAPPEVDLTTFFDKQLMEGLQNFARGIGAKLTTTTSGPPGYQIPGQPSQFVPGRPGEIATRFEAPEVVLAHEIGHEIDGQYPQLRQTLQRNKAAWAELESLADLRASGQVSRTYQDYLRSGPERVANLVAAYVHAPELLSNVAPHARQVLENLLTTTPRLQDLMSVKPSLEVGQATRAKRIAGPMLTGGYYMPGESANLVNRHLTPGLQGNPLYDAWMLPGNELSKWQLGLSAFHGLFTSLNSQATALDVAMRQVMTGKIDRSTLINAAEGLAPTFGLAPAIHDFVVGHKMRREWLNPGSTDALTAARLEAFLKAGGRQQMGSQYGFDAIERLRTAIRQKAGALPITGQALRAVSEVLAWPIMQQWVPKIKMGAWARMAAQESAMLGPNATEDAQRQAYHRAWQSVENRMGQMTYDNLFWNRAFRSFMHGMVRSVGWNAGDIGEFGGAVADLPSSAKGLAEGRGVSPRVGFSLAMPAVAAITGSILQYLLTGKGPEDARDAFFPRTGNINPDGTEERVALPSYMKDVYALTNGVSQDPPRLPENVYHMAKGKLHPALQASADFLDNTDFRGEAIRDPADPLQVQAYDELAHVLGAGKPISVTTYQREGKKGVNPVRQVAAGAGLLPPAPSYVTKPFEKQLAEEQAKKVQTTPLQKKRKSLQRDPGLIRPLLLPKRNKGVSGGR